MVLLSQRSEVLKKCSNSKEDITKPWAAVRPEDCNCLHYRINHVRRRLSPSLCNVRDWKTNFSASKF